MDRRTFLSTIGMAGTAMVAESDDGLHFRPLAQPEIQPEGGKRAPHHIFTLPSGSCGGVYVDPLATEGYRFKAFGHQGGKPVLERAQADPKHRWHSAAKAGREKPYFNEELTLVSRDGLHWEIRRDMAWGQPDWHREPPIFGFYNRPLGLHMMTVRPGWGDRRVCFQSTKDFRRWSGPELLLEPDPSDVDLCELYGMPVFSYRGHYVGLLWVFHCEMSEPVRGFNRSVGPLDCQLAYSFDGIRFSGPWLGRTSRPRNSRESRSGWKSGSVTRKSTLSTATSTFSMPRTGGCSRTGSRSILTPASDKRSS